MSIQIVGTRALLRRGTALRVVALATAGILAAPVAAQTTPAPADQTPATPPVQSGPPTTVTQSPTE